MGTRHFVGVILDGDWKVAQYGQWDGYPEGQGAVVFEFLDSIRRGKRSLTHFLDQLRSLRWATEDDVAKVNATENWTKEFPHLSRDAGATVLAYVYNGVEFLTDNRGFPLDSLFCEFAYVLNFDDDEEPILEFYTGLHKGPAQGRFADQEGTPEDYSPVTQVLSLPLADIPESGEDFVNMLNAACGIDEEADA